jgi:hypothetical protein
MCSAESIIEKKLDPAESIEWFIEALAFLPSYDSTHRPLPSPVSRLSFSVLLCIAGRSWESLALYKSFNTLWDAGIYGSTWLLVHAVLQITL